MQDGGGPDTDLSLRQKRPRRRLLWDLSVLMSRHQSRAWHAVKSYQQAKYFCLVFIQNVSFEGNS